MVTKEKTQINVLESTDGFISDFIYESVDYDKFSKVQGNRPENDNHVLEIIQSIKQHGYIKSQSILVTRDLYIIDGQHRFKACKELGIPVYFRMDQKKHDDPKLLGLIRALQNTQRRWTLVDAVDSLVLQGNSDYAKLKKWNEKYNIGYSIIVRCFQGVTKSITKEGKTRSINASATLHSGNFQIRTKGDEDRFVSFAETLNLIRSLKDIKVKESHWISQETFIYGLWAFLNSNNIDLNVFKAKLEKYYHKITKQSDKRVYVEMFLYIYNFKNHEKVSIKGYGDFMK